MQGPLFTAWNAQSRSPSVILPAHPDVVKARRRVQHANEPEAVATRLRPAQEHRTTHARIATLGAHECAAIRPANATAALRPKSGTATRRWGAPLRRWCQVQAHDVCGGHSRVSGCLRGARPPVRAVKGVVYRLDANPCQKVACFPEEAGPRAP